ncbi:MAG: cytochrome c3 family protein, partial [Rhodospirillales bacterium]
LGPAPIITRDQKFCVDCHGQLQQIAKRAPLLNVRDFGNDHPQFRPMIVTDAKQNKRQRMSLDRANWPKERTTLKFSHKQHLNAKGMRVPDKTERRVLQCRDCHQLQPNGINMVAIRMEPHCNECHLLQFEPARPKRVVPHGRAERVMTALEEFYGSVALSGGVDFGDAPPSVRRRPGTPLTKTQRMEALAWANARTRQTAEHIFRKSLCNTCHVVFGSSGKNGTVWNVEPVSVPVRWLPKGLFDHRAHENTACTDCHGAAESTSTTDVLLPQIGTCQACHGGEQAITGVPSTCVMCHQFHQPSLGPMRPNLGATARRDG